MSRLVRYCRLWRSLPDDERRARTGRVLERAGRSRRWIRRLGLVPDVPRRRAFRRALTCGVDELYTRLCAGDPRRGPLFGDTTPRARAAADSDPGYAERVAARARAVLARRVAMLGAPAEWPRTADGGVDWHVDWRTGARWPADEHHTRIETVRGDGSDVRLPWELARCQHLVTLGLARRLECADLEPDRCAADARALIDDWIAGNPRGLGIHWSCPMEVALRAVSWVATLALCVDAPSWDREFVTRLTRALWIHGRHVRRHLEIGPGGRTTNHYLSNLLGLYVVGCALPELREAAAWRRHALDGMAEEIDRQVHDDGVSFERSAGYHAFVVELFLQTALYARSRGDRLPPAFVARLAAMLDVVAAFGRPDGSLPAWGDADDGRVLPLDPSSDPRDLLAIGGALLDRPDLTAAAGPRTTEARWLLDLPTAAGSPRPATAARSRLFPDASVAVLRVDGTHVFIPCGAVGTRGLGNHTHNDLLSFVFWSDGVEWISDPGTGVYSGDIDLRNRLRATGAHSTVQLDRLEQNELGAGVDGLFTVAERARPGVVAWSADESRAELAARHRGFSGAIHERRFELSSAARTLTVVDRFDGNVDGRTATIRFVVRPGTRAHLEDGRTCLLERDGRTKRLEMSLPADARVAVVEAPFSPSYGVVTTSPVVQATFRATAGAPCAVTVIR